LSEQQESTGEL